MFTCLSFHDQICLIQGVLWMYIFLLWSSTRVLFQVIMMLSAGYFRIRSTLPEPVWKYPLSYIAFHTYSIQVHSWFYHFHPVLLRLNYNLRFASITEEIFFLPQFRINWLLLRKILFLLYVWFESIVFLFILRF